MKKRIFSLLLTLCMVLTLLPMQAIATGTAANNALTLEAGAYEGDPQKATLITSIAYYNTFSVRATVSGGT